MLGLTTAPRKSAERKTVATEWKPQAFLGVENFYDRGER